MANLNKDEWREGAGVILWTNIQEYKQDGKTKAGVKPLAFILGQLNQWFQRVLEGQERIETKLDQILENQKAGK